MKPLIYTFTGKRINPIDPSPNDIDIIDIAHALACTNRFAGHARVPVSVALHSVCVSKLVPSEFALQGLLHDASEAYLGDITKWLKMTDIMAPYREVEEHVQRVIFEKFGCSPMLHESVEWADKLMVRYECRESFPDGCNVIDAPNYGAVTPDEEKTIQKLYWAPIDWQLARSIFVQCFKRYSK